MSVTFCHILTTCQCQPVSLLYNLTEIIPGSRRRTSSPEHLYHKDRSYHKYLSNNLSSFLPASIISLRLHTARHHRSSPLSDRFHRQMTKHNPAKYPNTLAFTSYNLTEIHFTCTRTQTGVPQDT